MTATLTATMKVRLKISDDEEQSLEFNRWMTGYSPLAVLQVLSVTKSVV